MSHNNSDGNPVGHPNGDTDIRALIDTLTNSKSDYESVTITYPDGCAISVSKPNAHIISNTKSLSYPVSYTEL